MKALVYVGLNRREWHEHEDSVVDGSLEAQPVGI